MPRDVVGVVVGLEHVLDPYLVKAAQPQVRVDVPLRIDDRGDASVLVADEIRPATEVLVDDLAEQHQARALRARESPEVGLVAAICIVSLLRGRGKH